MPSICSTLVMSVAVSLTGVVFNASGQEATAPAKPAFPGMPAPAPTPAAATTPLGNPPAPAAAAAPAIADEAREIDLIAFGSCARERKAQPIWSQIVSAKPDLFLMIGDNHYADFWEKDGKMGMRPVEKIERIDEAYAALASIPGFTQLRAQCPMMATWDDHDYGANDAGKDFPLREQSKQAFLKFWGLAEDSSLREQPGVYNARTFGPAGRRVQVIMLDTRFNRDALERSPRDQRVSGRGAYIATADKGKTMLGEAQWAWLEEQLRTPADVRIIGSSIQMVADEHGYESWGTIPHERQRFYDLVAKTNASGVVVISGDRHLTEISVDRGSPGRAVPYPIWDFTSSGMNLDPGSANDVNTFRVGPVKREATYGTIQIVWGPTPEKTKIELTALGDQSQMLTRQTVFLSDLREPAIQGAAAGK